MQSTTFRLPVEDGIDLHVYKWSPDGPARAVVQIAHGMAEHGARYARLAEALTSAGYIVYANDHRGHGQTAIAPGDLGYFADEGGWLRTVDDLYRLNRHIAAEAPGLPIFLLGHSMGSFMAQDYLFTHGDTIVGAVLSGSAKGQPALSKLGLGVAKLERLRLGPRGRSALLEKLTKGSYNKAFEPRRTDSDWLSRDEAEVDAYVADSLCGFALTVQGWIDVLTGLARIGDDDNIRRVPEALPIYLFAGDLDPVGAQTVGVRSLMDAYQSAGLRDVQHKFYPGGRHEMLNETNREEVQADLIAWLDGALARRSGGSADSAA